MIMKPTKGRTVRLATASTGAERRLGTVLTVESNQRTVTVGLWTCPHEVFDRCAETDLQLFYGVPWSLLRL